MLNLWHKRKVQSFRIPAISLLLTVTSLPEVEMLLNTIFVTETFSSNGGQPLPAADDTSLVVLILHIIDGNSPVYHPYGQLTGIVGWKIQASDRVVTADESIRPLQRERMTTSAKEGMMCACSARWLRAVPCGFSETSSTPGLDSGNWGQTRHSPQPGGPTRENRASQLDWIQLTTDNTSQQRWKI